MLELSSPCGGQRMALRFRDKGIIRSFFNFDNKEDVDRILSTKPWSFDKSLVVT